MRKFAVVLSGCGYLDGSAITEAVSTYIALSELGAHYESFAPNSDFSSANHSDNTSSENRNALTESARITRGQTKPLADLKPENFDALILPGGFGAALNLSTWGTEGSKCSVNETLSSIIKNFHEDSKPIGAICIAPAIVAKVLGKHEVALTIGNDKATATEIEKTGALHEDCDVADYVTDRENKIVTTPAYMYGDAKPSEVFKGITGLVKELFEMA